MPCPPACRPAGPSTLSACHPAGPPVRSVALRPAGTPGHLVPQATKPTGEARLPAARRVFVSPILVSRRRPYLGRMVTCRSLSSYLDMVS